MPGLVIYSQNTGIDNIVTNLEDYNKDFSQQKVFLHLDKDYYYPGEIIWFKAYLVNATTHKPDTMSHNLFVELYDSNDESVSGKVLKLNNGFTKGDIKIPDTISDGNYMVKAFTTWMLNFNDDFIFKAPLYIENLEEENYVERSKIRQNRRFNRRLERRKESYEFGFYPEGGNIVAGAENRIAFKASNKLGEGINVQGEIKTTGGNVITDIESKHLGMGYFEFTPVPGKKYYAEVVFPDDNREKFPLPGIYESGYILRIDKLKELEKVSVKIEAIGDVSSELAVIGKTRGKVKYFEEFSLNDNKAELNISNTKFETGISQITLFDNNAVPVAERLVFIDNQDNLDIELIDMRLEEDDSKRVIIGVADKKGYQVDGSFSMGITKIPEKSNVSNGILEELLINSDLKGYIENPGYYFDEDNSDACKALDILMMTHGWRRFDTEKVASGNFPDIKYDIVSGLSIEGKVTMPSSRRGVDYANVEMVIHGDAEKSYNTETDRNGYFMIEGLDYSGMFKAEFFARRRDLGSNLRVEIEPSGFIMEQYPLGVYTNKHNITSRGVGWERLKRRLFRNDFKDDTGFSPSKGSDDHYLKDPDQVIYMEDISMPYSTLGNVLRGRVTGIAFDRTGQMTMRGKSSIKGSSQPLFFIDQIEIDQSRFMLLNPNDIDRVEIYKGPSTAILGVRGSNGALLAYSKRGGVEYLRTYIYQFMGYSTPREFFVQGEDELGEQIKNLEYQTLLWVPNIETTDEGRVTIDFHQELDPGKYKIRIEGLSNDGKLGSLNKVIEITEKNAID